MTEIKQYSERDAMELDEVGGYYFRHVLAMTAEGLHSKSDIAAELGWRDMQIAALHEQVRALAAEVESLREQSEEVYAAGYNHGHLNTVDGIAYAPGTKDDFYPNALQVMAEAETPATDAALREIRAQAVDGFAQDCDDNFGLVEPEDGELYELMAESARAHAASIRSGEQP